MKDDPMMTLANEVLGRIIKEDKLNKTDQHDLITIASYAIQEVKNNQALIEELERKLKDSDEEIENLKKKLIRQQVRKYDEHT